MKMLFVVGIEMSKVQSRRHCQFQGGRFGGRDGGLLGGARRERLRPQQHLKMPLTTERKFIAEIVVAFLFFFFIFHFSRGGRQVGAAMGRGEGSVYSLDSVRKIFSCCLYFYCKISKG